MESQLILTSHYMKTAQHIKVLNVNTALHKTIESIAELNLLSWFTFFWLAIREEAHKNVFFCKRLILHFSFGIFSLVLILLVIILCHMFI